MCDGLFDVLRNVNNNGENLMQYSIVKKSECSRYDFGYMLFSPEFFLQDKLACWNLLQKEHTYLVNDYFFYIKDSVNKINQKVICYDLTDGLPKFFDGGIEVSDIRSTKKIAKADDFAISRLRSYLEEMGIVENKKIKQLFSTEFLIFRPKTEKLSSHSLFGLCMTKFVQTILKRGQYGTEHPRFYDFLLTHLPVPDCLLLLDRSIKQTIKQALLLRSRSRETYNEAQTLLLSELGLADYQPKHRLTFVKNYSDTQRAERIDADYFQPKYEEIVNAIKSYSWGWDTLGDLATMEKCVEVGSKEYLDEGIPFVRVSNLSPFEITEEKYISEALYADIENHQPEQSEILFSKDATPGIAHYLREQPPKMIPAGGILRLKRKDDRVDNEYLALVLNSLLTKEQINRDVGGSVILHWRPDQVWRTVIPILPKEKQTRISQKVTESFNLRKRSKHALECAKRAVELAIEQDEQTAMDWLENETRAE